MTDKDFFTMAIEDLTARNTFLKLEISRVSRQIKKVRTKINQQKKEGQLICSSDNCKIPVRVNKGY
jgi:chaperonin cofactor prefoldin